MAVTISSSTIVNAKRFSSYGLITGDSSYPTGGWPLSGGQVTALCPGGGASGPSSFRFLAQAEPSGRTLVLDKANSKLKAFTPSVEVTNGTDLSAVSWSFESSGFVG